MLYYLQWHKAEGEAVTVKSVSCDERRAVFEMSSSSKSRAESGKISKNHFSWKFSIGHIFPQNQNTIEHWLHKSNEVLTLVCGTAWHQLFQEQFRQLRKIFQTLVREGVGSTVDHTPCFFVPPPLHKPAPPGQWGLRREERLKEFMLEMVEKNSWLRWCMKKQAG